MNKYTYEFFCACPVDGEIIKYIFTITTSETIMAEHIISACAIFKNLRHKQEYIAAQLKTQFGGMQTLTGEHGATNKVKIESVNGVA